MASKDSAGDEAWRDWYKKKNKLEMQRRRLNEKQKEREKKFLEGEQRKKEIQSRENFIQWLQRKQAERKQNEIKKKMQSPVSVLKSVNDPLDQQKKVEAWLAQKTGAARKVTLSKTEREEMERKKQDEMMLHKQKCEKSFQEWKRKKNNFRRPISPIVTNRDEYDYTGYHHPQQWQN